ncbi:hypothetical protein BC629DRAFT_1591488 [Irpex lacteus]|nr:hypothetical protein BC629DRAFT_1591488 [Irpex lacteus]
MFYQRLPLPARLQTRYHLLSRTFATTTTNQNAGKPRLYKELAAPVPPPPDPRRPWFFTVYRIMNFAIIPFAAAYCVFVADFGEQEHVFSPARRWMNRQRREFFSLSSEELELARSDSKGALSDSTSSQDKP